MSGLSLKGKLNQPHDEFTHSKRYSIHSHFESELIHSILKTPNETHEKI
jgi:hypothetical protein